MKKVTAILCATALVSVLPAAPAFAQADQAATIDKETGCGLNALEGYSLFSNEGNMSVVTSSGVTTLICRFDLAEGTEPAKAVRASGFQCGTFLGVTTDSKAVANPGGTAMLVCRLNTAGGPN